MWFEKLTGFCEENPSQVRKNISVNGEILKSLVNGKEYHCGILETPSLADLRKRVNQSDNSFGKLSVCEVIADTQQLHTEPLNAGALFQVASQFNLLEMVSPDVTPEQGVDGYEYDGTQGPACAVAAGAGTIYRNYFVNIHGEIGQSSNHQIDCLADLGIALGNSDHHLWEMRNGYVLATEKGLIEINQKISSASEPEIDHLRQLLRIGIQWDTEVTLGDSRHTVTQAYCSALPVAYSQSSPAKWEAFARMVLEASYKATVCASILNSQRTGNKKAYLTFVGGGVFGNEISWIVDAIERSLKIYQNIDLDICIVSFRHSNPHIQKFIRQF